MTVALLQMDGMAVRFRRHAQARRLVLRYDPASDEFRVSLPSGVSARTAERFVRDHRDWMLNERARHPHPLGPGDMLPYLGIGRRIAYTDISPRTIRLEEDCLTVGGPADQAPARLQRWLRASARAHIAPIARGYGDRLNVAPSRISIGDMRTRWGSCSSRGTLRFNWRIMLAPPPVVRYLVAHEVAHLLELNHSPRFWAHVARLCAEWRQHRSWLTHHGGALMAVRLAAV